MKDPYGVQKLMFENFTRLGAPINGKTQAHHLHFTERLEAIDTMQSELGTGSIIIFFLFHSIYPFFFAFSFIFFVFVFRKF